MNRTPGGCAHELPRGVRRTTTALTRATGNRAGSPCYPARVKRNPPGYSGSSQRTPRCATYRQGVDSTQGDGRDESAPHYYSRSGHRTREGRSPLTIRESTFVTTSNSISSTLAVVLGCPPYRQPQIWGFEQTFSVPRLTQPLPPDLKRLPIMSCRAA